MLRLLPHDDDDDDDSRDDLIFEISMEFSRKRLFLLLSRFQKEQRCFTNHTNATIDKALFFFFFFFFQNVKRSLLLAKRRKGSGERIHTERTQSGAKKLLFRVVMQERNPRPKKQKKVKKRQKRFFAPKKRQNTHHSCVFLLIQIIEREKEDRKTNITMTPMMMQTIHTQRYQSGNSATSSSSSSKKSTKQQPSSSSSFRFRGSGGAAALRKSGFNGDEKMIKRRRGRCALMSAAESSSEETTGDFEAALDPVYKNIFYDVPVSNNGARNRLIICWKNIEDEFEFKNPSTLGGLKSPEFLEMHPQGKMPLLVTKDGQAIPESEVISQYLCDAFEKQGPSLRPETLEAKTACNLATRWHDVYLTPIQGCMYRGPMSPEVRAEQISEIDRLLDVMEKTVGGFEPGPYLCGDKPSTADAALFPTFVFMTHLLPKYFGWENVFDGRPSLERWYKHMSTEDACAKKIKMEVMGGLMAWDESDRYEKNGLVAAVANDSFQWSY